LQRIKSLVIPPAWSAVWISPDPLGHLQVTGRDQRGRKQYRYHPRWRVIRDEAKYGKMLMFARVLPSTRARVEADLRRHDLPSERVVAAVVRLLEPTLFRIGNSEYARTNGSFGLTTLRDRHAQIEESHIHLSFRGKSGSRNETDINDPRLARVVKACRDLPGPREFGAKGELDTVLQHRAASENDVAAIKLLHSLGSHPMRDILGISLDRSVRDPADCHRERLGCAIGVLEHAVGQCEARRVPAGKSFARKSNGWLGNPRPDLPTRHCRRWPWCSTRRRPAPVAARNRRVQQRFCRVLRRVYRLRYDASSVRLAMVHLPAVNTPQFGRRRRPDRRPCTRPRRRGH
jgi:hypothetical protein